jgi:hemerythrin
MPQFSWTDGLHTGSTLIDGDHRKLIGLVNALFETMEGGRDNYLDSRRGATTAWARR